ncbi:hypothetical protein [Caballeronia sp. PC1]|uniref:hypothetical protein n=1 Tax=Caballeronia sp. PC1 TaxID=2906765 RepID=UPI001F3C8B86|nr:hypothetical protein [Caballeronia sp. PC1]MCE4542307.1 hypothetical protein [Caballeronia sp. PC1]
MNGKNLILPHRIVRLRWPRATHSILTVQNLLREFGRSAPGVSLVVKPGTRVDLGEMIDLGRIDVALGSFSEWPEHMRFDPMAAYRDVLISPIGSTPIERSDQLHSRRLAVVSVGGEEEGAIGGFFYERIGPKNRDVRQGST